MAQVSLKCWQNSTNWRTVSHESRWVSHRYSSLPHVWETAACSQGTCWITQWAGITFKLLHSHGLSKQVQLGPLLHRLFKKSFIRDLANSTLVVHDSVFSFIASFPFPVPHREQSWWLIFSYSKPGHKASKNWAALATSVSPFKARVESFTFSVAYWQCSLCSEPNNCSCQRPILLNMFIFSGHSSSVAAFKHNSLSNSKWLSLIGLKSFGDLKVSYSLIFVLFAALAEVFEFLWII